jgi:hypothetical protein
MVCGVNNEGRTLVFGMALIKDDRQESFKFVLDAFVSEIKILGLPLALIIERVSPLKNAFESLQRENPHCKQMTLLYCY